MTEAKANEIFRTKYPEGEILRRNSTSAGNKFWVMFKKDGKVYYYAEDSYAGLLNRLGFNVTYRHTIMSIEESLKWEKEDLEKMLRGEIDNLFIDPENEEQVREAIEYTKEQIAKYEEILKDYQENYYIDEV